jgi:hypothetical protein
MAAADYRLCDICNSKVFYDANLNYEINKSKTGIRYVGGEPSYQDLDNLGDWAVLCKECAKTYRTYIVKKDDFELFMKYYI